MRQTACSCFVPGKMVTVAGSILVILGASVSSSQAANTPPVISFLTDIATAVSMPTATIYFRVEDAETHPTNLLVQITSSNQAIVQDSGIQLSGSGMFRNFRAFPVPGTIGEVLLTISVTDGGGLSAARIINLSFGPFASADAAPVGLEHSMMAWVDLDNNGRMELVAFGTDKDFNARSFVYSNQTASAGFADLAIPALSEGACAWGDFNNDGLVDVVVTGLASNQISHVTQVYRNLGDRQFGLVANLTGVAASGAAWGDSDNDGDLDLALTGGTSGGAGISRLYRNDGNGAFVDLGVPLLGVSYSSVVWGDVDLDGDNDLLIAGAPSNFYTNAVARIYRNDGNNHFTLSPAVLPGMMDGTAALGDFDNDGDLDVFLAGHDIRDEGGAWVLRNEGNFVFTNILATLNGARYGSGGWGDYDQDGLLDLAYTGEYSRYVPGVWLFRNRGARSFIDSSLGLPVAVLGSVAWGDVDGDGDLDLGMCGRTNYGQIAPLMLQVYRNDSPTTNPAPSAPALVGVDLIGSFATFRWEPSTDANQPGGLTYNLRVGRTPGGDEVMSGMADFGTGIRRIPADGNAGSRTSWTLRSLPLGRYYWSVQAIDRSFRGSPFAPVQSFVINAPPGLGGIAIGSLVVPVGQSPIRIPFTVSDELTPLSNLVVTAFSENTNLVPASGIVMVGNGANRELILTPVPNTLGVTRITVTVADEHGGVSSDGFHLTVQNTPPSLPAFPSPVTISFSAAGTNLPFVVRDAESLPELLSVTAVSSNLSVLPAEGINITGSGSNRVLTLSPVSGQQGVAPVHVTATDPHGGVISRTFLLVVTNLSPILSAIPTQVRPTSPDPVLVTFTVSDAETPAADLRLELEVSNPAFIPTNNLVVSGTGTNRLLTITVPPFVSGAVLIVLRAHDEHGGVGTSSFALQVEDFTPVDVGLPAFQNSSVAWGDYDNDGDLDLLMTGRLAVGSVVSRVYRNVNGSFVDSVAGLTSMELGSCAWADFDGDRDLDIFISGEPSSVRSVRVYRNGWPAGGFVHVVGMIPGGIQATSLDLADQDHDGDLDLLLCGRLSGQPIAQVHRLVAPSSPFVQVRAFNGTAGRGSAWGDFDVDGDFDLQLAGAAAPQVYRNELQTNFSGISLPVPPLNLAASAWGDLDNDGDLDLAVCGAALNNSVYQPLTRLFRNDGPNGFVLVEANLRSAQNGQVSWADFDNDGWSDLLLTGNDGTVGVGGLLNPVSLLYRNNGDGTFLLRTNVLPGTDGGGHAWGDWDNDGDLDLILTGRGSSGRLHRNNTVRSNAPPAAPAELVAMVERNSVRLTWDAATDPQQLSGLTYNLRVGTNSAFEQVPAMASGDTGFRRLPHAGNAGAGLTRVLTNMPPGVYAWSVQAVDQSLAGSSFAPVNTFIVTNEFPVITPIPVQSIPRNRATPLLVFNISDLETPAESLVVAGFTSDPNLVLENRILIGGTGNSRTVEIVPNGEAEGVVTITLTVSDAHGGIASTSFDVEITQAAPSLTVATNLSTPFNTSTDPIPLTVSDPDNAATDLVVSGRSLNPEVVPDANITFGGQGTNRTMTINPALNRFGVVSIVITVRDPEGASDERVFQLTVQNAAPVIVGLTDQNVLPGVTSLSVPFIVGDLETPAGDLSVTVQTVGTNFIQGLSVSGKGSNQVMTVSIERQGMGTQSVQVVVADAGGLSVTSRFVVRLEYFTEVPSELTNFALTSIAVGDYDNDWDLDILLSGSLPGGALTTHLYRNDGFPGFVRVGNDVPTNVRAAVAWGDYDNDSDLDLAFIHRQGSRIYQNDGTGSFTAVDAALPSVSANGVSWGDYDGDGRQDLFITGITQDAGGPASLRIYRNAGNKQFREVPTAFPVLNAATGAWADFDGDGDLDVALSGQYGGSTLSTTQVYRNDEGRLDMVATNLQPVSGSLAWGDLDSDGDLDLAVMGGTAQPRRIYLYRNDDGEFGEVPATLEGAASGSLAWGDFDNDGWSDLVMSGLGIASGQVYRNRGDGTFLAIEPRLVSINQGSYVWGDFDGDGDLDLLGSGNLGANLTPTTRLYRNNVMNPNSPPSAPATLIAAVDLNNDATLQWASSSDAQTPAPALRYNLRVGTTPGGSEVVSAEAESLDGYRRVVRLGNGSANLRRVLRDLPAGDYYWSVQALDSAFTGSAFAPEQTFSVTNARPVVSEITDQLIYPGRPSGAVPFTVSDLETAASELGVTVISSNPEVLPNDSILVGGEGTNRTLVFSPGNERGGETTVSITVTDVFGASRSESFQVKVEYFSVITNVFPALGSSAAWGDSDGDGDLDLVITGYDTNQFTYYQSYARLWRNQGGTNFFAGSQLSLPGELGSLAWGDYDGDGDIDLLESGRSIVSVGILITLLHRNNGTTLSGIQSALPPVWSSAMDWGDYDNDGDLDLLIAGRAQTTGTNLLARIYRNLGSGIFTQAVAQLPGIHTGAALWADMDNDRDLDFLLTGAVTTETNGPGMTRLYRNDGGTNFVALPETLPAVSSSAAAWADFDNDGDVDLALSGLSGSNRLAAIFRNDGGGGWVDIDAGLPGVGEGTLSWGDFDGDGRLDLLMTGTTNGSASGALTRLYRQTDSGAFVEAPVGLPAVFAASAVWGDCDGDGDLDLYLGGPTTSNRVSHVLRNNSGRAAIVPLAPHRLVAQVEGRNVTLGWRSPADPPVSQPEIRLSSYNLRVGHSPGGNEAMPSQASPAGFRRLAELGNVTGSNSWTLRNLKPGGYFWSVQALNNGFAGSPFAPEAFFFITNTTPVLLPLQVTVTEDSVRVIPLEAVDPDDQALSYTVVTPPTNGVAGVNGSTVIYQPKLNYFGPDSFACQAYDGFAYSEPALIEVTVVPSPDTGNLHLSLVALPSGDTEVTLQGEPYAGHIIEVSNDLVTWTELTRMTASASGELVFVDPGPRVAQRFYRPRLDP